ncbi:MAG: 50S ribosomal protein L7ae [Clostridiales bacterium]|nr:50S ribosomal protein L7ae [Clostridiales bacterium]
MKDKQVGMLGLCRKAGKLSVGHDAVIQAIVASQAKLCLLAVDASERLKNEITHSASFGGKNIPVKLMPLGMEDVYFAVGTKAAVLSVNDEGFAKKIMQLFGEE